jgi:hypothetical protein
VYRYPFAVHEQAYCVWGLDLPERNDQFLRSFDPKFFQYLAEQHISQLGTENSQRAAVALRAAYHHSLETLFSLLGALAQAPNCVPAWLPKCSNRVLRDLVRDFSGGRPVLTQRGRHSLSWTTLANAVHSWAWQDEAPSGATSGRFAQLWGRLAGEFLDDYHTEEYNSFKHGFRISAGGFAMRVGLEHSYGVAPPESEMQWVGGSPHGIGFLKPESFPALGDGCKHHFRLRDAHLNWRAEAMAQAMQLVSVSVGNVIGALRVVNGAKAGTVKFERPEDPKAFDAPWQWSTGLTQGSFEILVDEAEVACSSRAALLAELEGRSTDPP